MIEISTSLPSAELYLPAGFGWNSTLCIWPNQIRLVVVLNEVSAGQDLWQCR